MSDRGKKKGFKVIGVIVVVIIVLIVGLLAGTFFLVKEANEKGVIMNGEWTYNGQTALEIDIEKETYTLEVDGIKESGKVTTVEMMYDLLKGETPEYTLTLDGNGTHDVDITIVVDEEGNEKMEFKSERYGKTYTFEQPAADE